MSKIIYTIIGVIVLLATSVNADEMHWFDLIDLSKEALSNHNHELAIEYAERALEDVDQELGIYHSESIEVLKYIIGMYHTLDFVNEYVEYNRIALPRYLYILEQKEREYGSISLELLHELGQISDIYTVLGKYEECIPYRKRILDLEKTYSHNLRDITLHYHMLAKCFERIGSNEAADTLLSDMIDYLINYPDTTSYRIPMAYHQYGLFLERTGRYIEAEQSYLSAYKIAQGKAKAIHEQLIYINVLADYYIKMKMYKEAEQILSEAKDIEQSNSEYSENIFDRTYINLGRLKQKQKCFDEAEACYLRVRKSVLERNKDRKSFRCKEISLLLADLYKDMGKSEESRIFRAAADGITIRKSKISQLYE